MRSLFPKKKWLGFALDYFKDGNIMDIELE
jgi:hypothetical protein